MHRRGRFLVLAIPAFALWLSLLVFATPAAAASPSHPVISQIKTIGSMGLSDELIELYNPTSQPLKLTGWSLQFKFAGFPYNAVQVATLPDITLAAGGYYLLRPIGQVTPADANYSAFSLIENAGNLFLVSSTSPIMSATDATVVDRLGYGSLADAFEGQPAPAPGVGQSLERRPGLDLNQGNSIDSDNNAADFVLRAIASPRTSAAAAQFPTPPTISSTVNPAADSYVTNQLVTISTKVTDKSLLTAANFNIKVDGQTVGLVSYSSTTQIVSVSPTLEQGTHTVILTVTDQAGLTSAVTWNFTVDTMTPTLTLTIDGGLTKTDQLAVPIHLTAADEPSGRASGVYQMQVAYDGVIDNEPWEPFQASLVRNLMNKEGLQAIVARVRDRAGNISPVASTTISLFFKKAPVAPVAAATAAPAAPVVTTAPVTPISTTTGNSVLITWNNVPNAVSYMVRYNDGRTLFAPLSTTETAVTITNLDVEHKTYHFEVAAVSSTGSVSAFTPVTPPNVGAPIAKVVTTPSPNPTPTPTPTVRPTPSLSPEATATPVASPPPSELPTPSAVASVSSTETPSPAIKASESTQPRDWTRVIVAVSILIIAAGVATGGWYLYQWWSGRPDDKGKGKTGRW